MKRTPLLEQLSRAESHVAQDERHIVRQQRFIDELRRAGHDTRAATALLREFERTHALHVAQRERVLAQLRRLTPGRGLLQYATG